MAADSISRPLQGRQRDGRVGRIEKAIKLGAGRVHPPRHGDLAEALLLHCRADLLRDQFLDGLAQRRQAAHQAVAGDSAEAPVDQGRDLRLIEAGQIDRLARLALTASTHGARSTAHRCASARRGGRCRSNRLDRRGSARTRYFAPGAVSVAAAAAACFLRHIAAMASHRAYC